MTKVEAIEALASVLTGETVSGSHTISEAIGELANVCDGFVMNSSTAQSTKKFKITVVDDGTISATEITD